MSRDEILSNNKQKKRMLYVVRADSPEGLCSKIATNDFEVILDVTGKLDFINGDGADQNSNLIFDLNNLYLTGYGDRKFFMVNLRRRTSIVKGSNSSQGR
jgi:hypothetical protein